MSANLQPGMHPDADQITTFVEGAAARWEREQMLAHLALCADCRRVVFLMQGQEEAHAAQPDASRGWFWRRWVMPVGLAGAALACGLVVLVYERSQRGVPENGQQSAKVEVPGGVPTGNAVAGAAAPRAVKPANALRRRAVGLGASESLGAGTGGRLAIPSLELERRPTTAGAPAPQAGAGGAREVSGTIAGANVAPAPAGKTANEAAAEADGQAAANATIAGIQTANQNAAVPQFATRGREPSLRIEHESGPENGLSEVTGIVTDQTGAIVAGATVSLSDAAQGKTWSTVSGATGLFSLPQVPAGHYGLKVTARGFEGYLQAVDLKPNELARLDSKLTVGSESQTVTVVADALAVQTDSNVVSTLISSEQVSQIATENRNFAALGALGLGGAGHAKTAVTLGKRVLSLDGVGTLIVSRNSGKSWKKVKPQWAGKVTRIEVVNAGAGSPNATNVFQLTTDAGAVWTSGDGVHWRAR